jgi:hypothetical protein
MFVVFPAACRVVELDLFHAYRHIVWPALWPALVVMSVVALTRHLLPVGLLAVLAQLAMAAIAYGVLFFACGLEREERQWFTVKLAELWRRRSQVLAAA